MPTTRTEPVDFIAELRLRQWARANYVAPEARDDSEWHPVVLDEMRRKDTDLLLQRKATESARLMARDRNITRRIDATHESVPPSHFSTPSIGNAFVPFYA